MNKFYLILPILILIACQKNEATTPEDILKDTLIQCDAETIEEWEGKQCFKSTNSSFYIEGGQYQSTEEARSGKNSVKVDTSSESAFVLKLKHLKPGAYVRASVWQKEGNPTGAMLITVKYKGAAQAYQTYYNHSEIIENGWLQHNYALIISPNTEELRIEVICKKGTTYFDDLKVNVLPQVPPNELDNEMSIFLSEKSRTTFFDYINKARHGEIIQGKYKEYVKGRLWDGKKYLRMKMKLKGDWNDHLGSAKVSARIKVRGDSAYHGLKSFSVQHPRTRCYLDEWVVHKIAEQEDVLTTTYDFVNVNFYNTALGVYALEEHFDKQLLESRQRREGPILKMDEDGVWAMSVLKNKIGDFGQLPYFKASAIDVFKDNRTMREMNLRLNFIEGSKLLQQFKEGSSNLASLFDLNQLAKYYAILDLSEGLHALAWHNRRYYFNPITQKLEMIIYDVMPFDKHVKYYGIFEFLLGDYPRFLADGLDNQLLTNREFKKYYLQHLNRMSSKAYLDSFFVNHEASIVKFEQAIQTEEPYYRFDRTKFYESAAYLKKNMKKLDEFWTKQINRVESFKHWSKHRTYQPRNDSAFVEKISLNAYLQDSSNGVYTVLVENYHVNEIEVCGYELENWKNHVFELKPKLKLKPFSVKADSALLQFNAIPDKLFFKASNHLSRYYDVKVKPWPKPAGLTDRQKLERASHWKKYGSIKGNKFVLSGKVEIDQLIYIPEAYELQIKAGTTINFTHGGGIIANNNVNAVGTSSQPIHLTSTDSSSNGFTILNANRTKLHYLMADKLSNLSYGNWMLTGAITVYQSEVDIQHCTISNSKSEDALNLIRCNFEINDLSINKALSDGFDADFCKGYLKHSYFDQTLNDAIDFSGSTITIDDVDIKNAGDKGISGGEKSNLLLKDIVISSCVTAVVAKDETVIEGTLKSIENSPYHFMAFQKKEEYGPAILRLTGDQIDLDENKVIIGKGSIININDKRLEGNERVNVDSLYSTIAK